MNRKELTRKLLLRPLDWITLTPFVAGVTLAFALWALALKSAVLWFLGIAAVLAAAGVYCQRLFLGWDRHSQAIVDRWRRETEGRKEQELDELYTQLQADGDPRTENLLQDLRTLTRAMADDAALSSDLTALRAFDIVSDVDRLFGVSVSYLRQSLELWRTADRMANKAVAGRLLEQREELIGEVQRSLEQLGAVLADMKKLTIDSDKHSRLDTLRGQLEGHLRAAQKVEERMLNWGGGVSADDEEIYLRESAGH